MERTYSSPCRKSSVEVTAAEFRMQRIVDDNVKAPIRHTVINISAPNKMAAHGC